MQASLLPQNGRAGPDTLLRALAALDRLLELALDIAPQIYGWEPGSNHFRGLFISRADAGRMLESEPGAPPFNLPAEAVDTLADSPLIAALSETYGLARFDGAALLIALAPEVDLRYERVYAFLQDDVARRRPSVDLILNLLSASAAEKLERRRQFTPEAPLLRVPLVHLVEEANQLQPPLLAHTVKADERIIREVLGQNELDSRLVGICERLTTEVALESLPLEPGIAAGLRSLALWGRGEGDPLRLWFRGEPLPLKRLAAAALAGEMGRQLAVVNAARIAAETELLQIAIAEARLSNAVLFLDADGSAPDVMERLCPALIPALAGSSIDAIVSAQSLPAAADRLAMLEVNFAPASFPVRREQWRRALGARAFELEAAQLDSLAGRFRLYPDQITSAVEAARAQARWRGEHRPAVRDLSIAARAQSGRQIGAAARKIEPSYSWSDIVLPPATLGQLRSICSRVSQRHRVLDAWGFDRKLSMGKGVTALFAGPSGVGKTMAAEVLARELGIDLYKIDLSGVVSKYIGETEKNLERLFAAAENANAILFFDEADALFGKRSEVRDSHDRYANIEISYLLQKMEMYDGIAILASNLRQNLDEAFVRRLAYTVHFPFPDEAQRRLIWSAIWPPEAPIEDGIDFEFLAARFKLSGGNIKNIALAAAFAAAEEGSAIGMRHLVAAIEREYQKMSKPLARDHFGPYAEEAPS